MASDDVPRLHLMVKGRRLRIIRHIEMGGLCGHRRSIRFDYAKYGNCLYAEITIGPGSGKGRRARFSVDIMGLIKRPLPDDLERASKLADVPQHRLLAELWNEAPRYLLKRR